MPTLQFINTKQMVAWLLLSQGGCCLQGQAIVWPLNTVAQTHFEMCNANVQAAACRNWALQTLSPEQYPPQTGHVCSAV